MNMNMLYIIAAFGVGALSLGITRKLKTRRAKMMVTIPCIVVMLFLMALWNQVI